MGKPGIGSREEDWLLGSGPLSILLWFDCKRGQQRSEQPPPLQNSSNILDPTAKPACKSGMFGVIRGMFAAVFTDVNHRQTVGGRSALSCGLTPTNQPEQSRSTVGGAREEDSRSTYKHVWSWSRAQRTGQGLQEVWGLSKEQLLLRLQVC